MNLQQLNLPKFKAKIQKKGGKIYIFDIIRKDYFVLTPEEWVRQNVIHFLINTHNYSPNYIQIEKQIKLNGRNKRFDILIYDKQGEVFLLIECKAPNIKISETTFAQIASYNMVLKVPYLLVTNGLDHFICSVDFENESYDFLQEIPKFG